LGIETILSNEKDFAVVPFYFWRKSTKHFGAMAAPAALRQFIT